MKNMPICSDYEDLFKILNTYQIKYVVVGAYAVMYYTEPRYTKDIDLWIFADLNNPETIYKALKEFGVPLLDTTPDDFKNKHMIFQIGVAPVRIDLIMDLAHVPFEEAWNNKQTIKYGDTPIHILGLKELIIAKKVAGRLQDQLDLENIEKFIKPK